jgi:integrase
LDRHLELNKRGLLKQRPYSLSNRKLYQYTRDVLARIEAAGESIACSSFRTVTDFKRLENLIGLHSKEGIGKTVLSMHMQVVKAFCKTGADPDHGLNWITTDAYRRYSKPVREEGTEPVSQADFLRILAFDVENDIKNSPHTRDHLVMYRKEVYGFARDFWCAMVYGGGMEVRDIVLLERKKLDPARGVFSFVRTKTKDEGAGQIIVPYASIPHWNYVISRYGAKGGKYVFPFVKEGMTEAEIEAQINLVYSKITDNMGRIAEILSIDPKPTCKRARPTFATMAANNGVDIRQIQAMMGHKNLSTTEIYLKRMPLDAKVHDSREAVSKLPGLVKQAVPEVVYMKIA